MATRNKERVRYRYGICLNDNCEKCKSKEVQQVPARKEFVCQNPECGKPLRECPPPKKGANMKLIAMIAGAVAILAIIGILIFSGGKPNVEKLELDKSKVTLRIGQSEQLKVTITPQDEQVQLLWESSDASVATINNGTILANKAGKATIKVFVKDQEEVCAECECTVIEHDVNIETLDIMEDPLILRPGGHQQLTVNFTPENQNENIIWTSSDDAIARVSPKGKVEAIKVGQCVIIAKSDRTGIADTATVSVEGVAEKPEKPAPEEKPAAAKTTSQPVNKPAAVTKSTTSPVSQPKPAASGSKNLGYATFRGSWPNDVSGRMIFKSSHVIDSKDPKKRVAEAGDYVIGEWSDGHLVQGIWYGADNQVKGSIIIGK